MTTIPVSGFVVAFNLEMGTMAAWFGCLIMLQLLLFMSKPASKKLKSSTTPPLKVVREDSTVFWFDFWAFRRIMASYELEMTQDMLSKEETNFVKAP